MNKAELQNLRDRAQDTIERIDKELASMTEKPTPERPFRRGEPVIMWDDERSQFIGFFVKTEGSGFVVSGNSGLFHSLPWIHCKHLPPFIDWSLVGPHFRYAAEYDSGMVAARSYAPEVGNKNELGTVVAVHKRPEAQK